MELAKGNISENMPRMLNLNVEECAKLVSISDKIYYLEQETEGIQEIVNILTEYREQESVSDDKKAKSIEEYGKLIKRDLYIDLVDKSAEYSEYLRENRRKNTRPLDKKIVFLENRNERNRIETKELTCKFLELVYKKYYRKRVAEVRKGESKASYQEMRTFEGIYKILSRVMKMDNIYDENDIYSNSKVQEYVRKGYSELFTIFMKGSLRERQKSFKEGLSAEKRIVYSTTGKPLDVEAEFGEYNEDDEYAYDEDTCYDEEEK